MPLPKLILETEGRRAAALKRFFSIPQYFKSSRPTTSPVTPIHRCLLVSEIFCLILEFIQQYDESPKECECKGNHTLGRRTLLSLARTCRVFSVPALDLLWMRLDSLDPLVKVLPSRIWAKKHSRLVVRMLMSDKHWSTFRKYAIRVRFLRGPCRDIPPSVQRNVVTALAQFPKASLPLLPNLMELVWSESDPFSIIDSTVPLIKFFARPGVTSISLFLVSWPIYLSAHTVLADLPILFPNVTSFTVITSHTLDDYSQEIGNIVRRWSNLRVLRSCALSQAVMDELASHKMLDTLKVELNKYVTDTYMDKLPSMVHTFSLEGSNTSLCIRYLQTLQGSPTSLYLYVGLDFTLPSNMDTLFQMLPTRFDTTRLQNLSISLTLSYARERALIPSSFPLTESLVASLSPFSSLVTLDLDRFCASELDDAAYERMAGTWRNLTSLKVGVEDVFRAKPVASVGAVLAVLRSCARLQTLHIVFDGSIPPPPPMQPELNGVQGGTEGRITDRAPSWGISNRHIVQIHVGHSPTGENMEGIKDLARCLRSVMPRLERIQSTKGPPPMFDAMVFGVMGLDGWQTVQHLLLGGDMNSMTFPEITQLDTN